MIRMASIGTIGFCSRLTATGSGRPRRPHIWSRYSTSRCTACRRWIGTSRSLPRAATTSSYSTLVRAPYIKEELALTRFENAKIEHFPLSVPRVVVEFLWSFRAQGQILGSHHREWAGRAE
ncbi:unnamed protein product [Prorocentrum cordatum]|uniref:Uncharacterized protein n=1 Tax=Prorocentrum cordatum TaxID=2364126 RepID=A0ABN9UFV5_9DINO|nr:unnamed protein product [Polarella glacialis]